MWRDLEARADLSFFQSWTWTGCLYEERFSHPVLLRVEREGTDIALGLFNRAGLSLHLGTSGAADLDCIYIEHNGFVRARGEDLNPVSLLRAARSGGWMPRGVVLSGVADNYVTAARAAGGHVSMRRTHVAPVRDLTISGRDWIASLNANTRQQLRRSARAFAAAGTLHVERAASVAEAWEFLDALMKLHQRTWEGRGKPGAFAQPFFRRFHRELIARGLPRDEIDLLRISAGKSVIGYLYNFRFRGHVLAYQSGFDYAAATGARKPGMTCHHMAIAMYAAADVRVYDFLAGDAQYKRSLANSQTAMHWLTLYPVFTAFWRG